MHQTQEMKLVLCLGLLLSFISAHSYDGEESNFVYSVTVSNAKDLVAQETGVYVQIFGYGLDGVRVSNTTIITSDTPEWNEKFVFDDNDVGAYEYFLFKLYGDSFLGETETISVFDIKDCDAIYSTELDVINERDTGTLFVEISKIGCDASSDSRGSRKTKDEDSDSNSSDGSSSSSSDDDDDDSISSDNGYISPQDILNSKTISSFIGFTRDQWKNVKPLMHPTQPDVGFAWMIRKVCSDFDSAENAQSEMMPIWAHRWPNLNRSDLLQTENTLPCIIGPSGPDTDELVFYVIDSHHTLSALDYSGYDETWIYINILNDFRMYSYEVFVNEMKYHKNTYLYGQKGRKKELPELVEFSELPNTFGTMGDSTWRSLAGYSRKVKIAPQPYPECNTDEGHYKYCMRPFMRICGDDGNGIPFYEFMWGYFYVDAAYFKTTYWNDEDALNVFMKAYDDLLDKYYDTNGNFIHPQFPEQCEEVVDDWLYGASLLVPLARGDKTAQYSPIEYFGCDTLPGYIVGPQRVDKDPDCDFNTGAHAPHVED